MLIFAAICFGCALFFIISMLTGAGDSDADFHGGDLGHGGIGEGGDVSHEDVGVAHHDVAGAPKIFSVRIIMLFGMGFGAVGAIARYAGASIPVSSIYGFLSGVVLGGAGYFFFRIIFQQQASTPMLTNYLINKTAEVITAIPINGLGQVLTTDNYGRNVYYAARSEDGNAVPANTTVTIVNVSGNIVIVRIQ